MNESKSSDTMEQVRNLLFGNQIKELDTQIGRQHDSLLNNMQNIQSELKSQINILEEFMKSEISSVLQKIRKEQDERSVSLSNIADALSSLADDNDRKLTVISNSLESLERDLRELILTNTNSINARIQENYEECTSKINSTVNEIREDMVYKKGLATILTKLAIELSSAPINNDNNIIEESGEELPIMQETSIQEGDVLQVLQENGDDGIDWASSDFENLYKKS